MRLKAHNCHRQIQIATAVDQRFDNFPMSRMKAIVVTHRSNASMMSGCDIVLAANELHLIRPGTAY